MNAVLYSFTADDGLRLSIVRRRVLWADGERFCVCHEHEGRRSILKVCRDENDARRFLADELAFLGFVAGARDLVTSTPPVVPASFAVLLTWFDGQTELRGTHASERLARESIPSVLASVPSLHRSQVVVSLAQITPVLS